MTDPATIPERLPTKQGLEALELELIHTNMVLYGAILDLVYPAELKESPRD